MLRHILRSKEDILQEIDVLQRGLLDSFERNVIFKDFSDEVLPPDLVPRELVRGQRLRPVLEQRGRGPAGRPGQLSGRERPRSMVIIDSLTDLVLSTKIETTDLVAVLRACSGSASAGPAWSTSPDQGHHGREDAAHDHGLGGRGPGVRMEQVRHLLQAAALHATWRSS